MGPADSAGCAGLDGAMTGGVCPATCWACMSSCSISSCEIFSLSPAIGILSRRDCESQKDFANQQLNRSVNPLTICCDDLHHSSCRRRLAYCSINENSLKTTF